MRALSQRLGLEPVDPPTLEGTATRMAARDGDGQLVLLYQWRDHERARRAARAMGQGLGSELFAVPTLIEAEPDQGWVLVTRPEGSPLTAALAERGARTPGELDAGLGRALLESVGVLTRKLHSLEAGGVFGELPDPDQQTPARAQGTWNTFNGWVADRLERYAEALGQLELPEAERLELRESLGDLRHELSAFHPRHPATLTHNALGAEHLWVEPHSMEVSGLTGFGHALLLPAEADLAYLLWLEGIIAHPHLVRAFYTGYGAARTMDVQRRERFYRRLAAFEVLLGQRRELCPRPRAELLEMSGPGVIDLASR